MLLLTCNAEKVVISNIDCVVKYLEVLPLFGCNHFDSFDEILSLFRSNIQRCLLAIVHQWFHLLHHNFILQLVLKIPSGWDATFNHFIDFYLVREFVTSLILFFGSRLFRCLIFWRQCLVGIATLHILIFFLDFGMLEWANLEVILDLLARLFIRLWISD